MFLGVVFGEQPFAVIPVDPNRYANLAGSLALLILVAIGWHRLAQRDKDRAVLPPRLVAILAMLPAAEAAELREAMTRPLATATRRNLFIGDLLFGFAVAYSTLEILLDVDSVVRAFLTGIVVAWKVGAWAWQTYDARP